MILVKKITLIGQLKQKEKFFSLNHHLTKFKNSKQRRGEITSIAIIAGIMGAKKTSELIPLCHNIDIENINIEIIAKPKNICSSSYINCKE